MLNDLQAYADELLIRHQIPAVSLAIWQEGKLSAAASGILNLETGVEANTDAIFQIGSITKIFTTCLVMMLVEQGRVDIDAPVKRYIRDFQIADKQAGDSMTVRQLLNHTSGLAGDYFPDDHHEDGPHIARYVDRCSQLPLIHPVGKSFSYCNTGFTLAGRLVEIILGISWHQAMKELIFQPLGMTHAITRPSEVIRFRTALGHIADENHPEKWHTCSGKYLCLGQAPAGLTATMTATDLITFARAHMEEGVNCQGQSWLSKSSIQLMQKPSVEVPIFSDEVTTQLGLGWFIFGYHASGHRYLQHTGLTNGQSAVLRIFPEQKACFAVLLNSHKPGVLDSIGGELMREITGFEAPANPTDRVKLSQAQLALYEGDYCAYLGDYRIRLGAEGLLGLVNNKVDEAPEYKVTLRALGNHNFAIFSEQGISAGTLRFLSLDAQGRPQQLFAGVRLFQRAN